MIEEVVEPENEQNESSSPAPSGESRVQAEREGHSREAILAAIEGSDWLQIPTEVTERYKSEGYVLRWIRIMLDGDEDFQNIGKKEREGWQFIMAKECPELATGFRIREEGSLAGCILRGDVALAKQPIEYSEAKKRATAQRTEQMEQAIKNRLMSDHPDRRMPITDSSKSRVSTGQRARFDA